MLLQDSRLRWPDTFSQGPDGTLYVTASHIQDSPWFHPSGWRDHDFALYKFAPPQDDFSSSAASAKPKDDAHTVTSGTAPH
jgi:hypothetical protein